MHEKVRINRNLTFDSTNKFKFIRRMKIILFINFCPILLFLHEYYHQLIAMFMNGSEQARDAFGRFCMIFSKVIMILGNETRS